MRANDFLFLMTNNPYLSKITVVKINPLNQGNLKAFATIKLGNTMTISGCRVIQQPGQRAYVALPQTKDDQGKYWPVITADDPQFKEAVQEKVLDAWQGDNGGRR